VALVRKRTIPTERLLLVGEGRANFLWIEGVAWSARQILTAVNSMHIIRERTKNHFKCVILSESHN
jgi:hypothetical protein